MALETGTYINDLVATNPVSGDVVSQGDDHLRLIKNVLLNSFPGLSAPIDASYINAVKRTGDTMTGQLIISPTAQGARLSIIAPTGGYNTSLELNQSGHSSKWFMGKVADSFSLVFSTNFDLSSPVMSLGSSGNLALSGDLTVAGELILGSLAGDGARFSATSAGAILLEGFNGGIAEGHLYIDKDDIYFGTTKLSPRVYRTGGGDVLVADGGTGASTAADARFNLGAAPTVSPTFTGTMTAGALNMSGDLVVGNDPTGWTADGVRLEAGGSIYATNTNGVLMALNRNGTTGHVLQFLSEGSIIGAIADAGASVSYNTTSDGELKEAVADVSRAGVVAQVKAGRPVEFEWKGRRGAKHFGFIAQEMMSVFPDAVTPGDGETPWMMDHSKLVPVLWAALQDALARIEALEAAR